MRGLFLLIFLSIMSVVSAGTAVLWAYAGGKRQKKKYIVAALAVTASAVGIVGLYEERYHLIRNLPYVKAAQYAAALSLDWLITLFVFFPVAVIAAFFVYVFKRRSKNKKDVKEGQEHTFSRRTFVKGLAALPLALGIVNGWGLFAGNNIVETLRYACTFAALPKRLDGYRIGQISDFHIGVFLNAGDLRECVLAMAAENPDMLVITGDLIDEMCLNPDCGRVLAETVGLFPDGVYFCYGNHEYYHNIREITAMLEKAGVAVLRNDGIVVRPQRFKDTAFYLAGTDYSFAKGDDAFREECRLYTGRSLRRRQGEMFTVLLAHHPDFFDAAAERKIPLTLSGHTHGAQVMPLGEIVKKRFKYLRGFYKQGESLCYVNRGTGHWLPLRLGCSREMNVFELHCGDGTAYVSY